MSARVTISVTGCSPTGVHLHEIEVSRRIQEELDRTGTRVSQLLASGDRRITHCMAQLRGQNRRRRFFEELLVTSLNRTLAFAQVDALTMFISEHLNLDVPRLVKVTFDVDTAVFESRRRLR
jgi:hypothetical protein